MDCSLGQADVRNLPSTGRRDRQLNLSMTTLSRVNSNIIQVSKSLVYLLT